jgi:hypothetical protein
MGKLPRLFELATSFDSSVWCGDTCINPRGGSADRPVVVRAVSTQHAIIREWQRDFFLDQAIKRFIESINKQYNSMV